MLFLMRNLIVIFLVLLAALPASAAAHIYQIDPIHTRIVFFVDHTGFSRTIATAFDITGQIVYDEKAPDTSTVIAIMPVDRIDFGDSRWNKKMLGRTWFNSKKFPEAKFTSTKVSMSENNKLKIEGTLTIRGISMPVMIDAKLNAAKRNPLTFRQTIGFSGKTILKRSDFGMDKFKNMIGEQVEVLIELEAKRGKSATDKTDGESNAVT